MRKMLVTLFLLMILSVLTGYAHAALSLQLESSYISMGAIEPGKASYDFSYNRDAKISVTCNVDDTAWHLDVSCAAIMGNSFDQSNVQLQVYYIGYLDPVTNGWVNVDPLSSFVLNGFSSKYNPLTTTVQMITNYSKFPAGTRKIKIVLGTIVKVPEGGRNLAGDYVAPIQFDLTN